MAHGMYPLQTSLVKFEPAISASECRKPRLLLRVKSGMGVGALGASAQVSAGPRGTHHVGTATGGAVRKPPPIDDLLAAILPPRQFTDERGQAMVQHVSAQPSTRMDAIHLQEQLDERLLLRQARDTGICPIRSELYRQGFDELIRQIAVDSPERGLLLLRIRDDLEMTLSAHRALYRSTIAFGDRTINVSKDKDGELSHATGKLESDRTALELQLCDLQARCEAIEAKGQAQRVLDEKQHNDEVQFFRKTNQQLNLQ